MRKETIYKQKKNKQFIDFAKVDSYENFIKEKNEKDKIE